MRGETGNAHDRTYLDLAQRRMLSNQQTPQATTEYVKPALGVKTLKYQQLKLG